MLETSFINPLKENKIEKILPLAKGEFHNHLALGGSFFEFCKRANVSIPPPPSKMKQLGEMNDYIFETLRPYILTRDGFELSLRLAFEQAVNDGITILESSVDCFFALQYTDGVDGMIRYIRALQDEFKGKLEYRPEIGFSRQPEVRTTEQTLIPCIESGYFTSIDLYGEELAKPASMFKEIYKLAGRHNLKRKSHAGEFGTDEDVRKTVEILELDEVQHGIAAANSKEIMRWLAQNNIRLNICPTSNVLLSRVQEMKTHPARILYDNGITLSINTDDYFIFHKSVSEEYLSLYNAGVLNAEELEKIRLGTIS